MSKLRFSANLGYLWADNSLLDAISFASRAGFNAVEMHFPYANDALDLRTSLQSHNLPLVSINTAPGISISGHLPTGEFGLSALVGREKEARATLDQAISYAKAAGAGFVHVLAGCAEGPAAAATLEQNLRYALSTLDGSGVRLLVEPINPFDIPGYFMNDPARAAALIDRIGSPDLGMMFDCYHIGRMGRDIAEEFRTHRDQIFHVQFAAVPDRGNPAKGDVDYSRLLPQLQELGYAGYFGAEYRPCGPTEDDLGWMNSFQQSTPAFAGR